MRHQQGQRCSVKSKVINDRSRLTFAVANAIAALAIVSPVYSQESERRGASTALLEEVVVTARKREEGSQDVPLQVSAFGSDQLEALKVRDLTNLAVGMPNVALDDVGTTRGTANFSIRGLGINSSIVSIDPTVGIFINGVYLGLNTDVIFDVFDLESIEVLRGPQGILFGRNVTGGAVLMNTKKPGEEFEATVRAAVDGGGPGGINRYLMGTIGGPVTDNLGLKLTAYLNDDEGWNENLFNGQSVQAIRQEMVRGTMVWNPTDRGELVVRYEHTTTDGDGAAPQAHPTNLGGVPDVPSLPGFWFNADPDSFDISYDEIGFQKTETDFLTVEYNHDVDFGEGTITALYGWRDSEARNKSDIDGQPVPLFHASSDTLAEQHSFELRYNGQFGDANVTVGGYWFDNDIVYAENREILEIATGDIGVPFLIQDGGGFYQVETRAIFGNVDYALTDLLTLSVGARLSDEKKAVQLTQLAFNRNGFAGLDDSGAPIYINPLTGTDTRCNVARGPQCNLDFIDDDSWQTFAPKIGLSYLIGDDAQVYGHWSRGFRSGGYNMRANSPTTPPGPFDEETVDSFEFGYKSVHDWGKLNAAVFYNMIDDMQRELDVPDPTVASVQIITNTADATIWGAELDATIKLAENLLLLVSGGYTNASYDEVRLDLTGDGIVDGRDKALDLPRAPELTYSVGLTYDFDVGSWGYATARINYAYRDEAAFLDDNTGIIPEQDILDLGLDFYSNSASWVLSVYGRNMLDTVKWGGDSQGTEFIGPVPRGGTFSPLAKGQVYGIEVTYSF